MPPDGHRSGCPVLRKTGSENNIPPMGKLLTMIRISPRELQYLIALDEERHFGRAAERCFVSQPTLSGQLKKLEDSLGIQLVERGRKRVRMSDAGREIAARARRILAELRDLETVAESYRDPMAGELRVGLIPTVAPYLLPLIMPALRHDFPRLKLMLHEHQTAVLLEKLRGGELDLAILALPVETDEFTEYTAYEESFELAVPKGHPLATKERASLDDLKGLAVLLLEEGHCLRGQALDVCLRAGAGEYANFRATSLETLRHMVGEGIGITLMPKLAVNAGDEAIAYVPFEDPKPSRRIGLLWRPTSGRKACFEALGKLIRSTVRE